MPGEVFISYRKDDVAYAGRLYDFLSEAIGKDRVVLNPSYPRVANPRDVLRSYISKAIVVLVIIGPDWTAGLRDEAPARFGVEDALNLQKVVIPVLVDGAVMPRASALPESIQGISRRNAVELQQKTFQRDVRSLAHIVERYLRDGSPQPPVEDISVAAAEPETEVAWRKVKNSSKADDVRDFIARFPNSERIELAQTQMELLLWSEIGETPTTVSVLAYLAQYPNGFFEKEARKWLASRLEALREALESLDARKADANREMELIVGPPPAYRNDVFVSYSKTEPEITKGIVAALVNEGYKVWWDTNLVSGDEFSDVIRRELVGSKAVVVVWTATSIKSKWVRAEAQMADFDDKLVPVRPSALDPRSIPLPFNVHHCELIEDHDALIKAIQKKGVFPSSQPAARE
jgi:hypothetical protein